VEAPLLEQNIWQVYRDRGILVFAMTRQSYEVAEEWINEFNLTHPVVHDPEPSESYWKYSHGYIPQNTLTDQGFIVIYDAIGYDENELIQAIEAHLFDVSLVLDRTDAEVMRGGIFEFSVDLKNWGEQPVTFDIWADVILPDHSLLTEAPVLGPATFTLLPGQAATGYPALYFPGNIPPGNDYRIRMQIGDFGSEVWNCDLLKFDIKAGKSELGED